MSQREWKRYVMVKRIEKGVLTVGQVAQALGLSRRQVQRLRRRVATQGERGVVHASAGRVAPNRASTRLQKRVLRLARTAYVGFNDQHLTEKLVEVEGLTVSRASVRRWLRAAGIGPARRRRPPQHRRRRDRMRQAGLMVLWDGSRHDWLEGRGPMLCLMGAIDDATGELLPGAHFVDQECAAGYLRVLDAIAREKGLPCSIYMDRHGSLKRNDDVWTLEEELRGEQDPTQVGRALKALEITPIYALSPQAKGRVERLWGTLQDRLVSELRLARARTAAQANAFLAGYRAVFNRRFALAAADATPAWRPLGAGLDLERACSFCYEARVDNDNAVRFAGGIIDIPPGPRGRSYARAKVELRQLLDGTWAVYYHDDRIATGAPSGLGELKPRRRHKRPAASKAFRRAIVQVAASLP